MRIGKVTDSVLKRSVIKLLKDNSNKKSAVVTPDCACSIDGENRKLVSAVSTFTVDAKGGGYNAMYKASNNIFAVGAKPQMAVVNILLDSNTEEADLKDIVRDCKRAADELSIPIRGGHTEVSDALSRPLVSVYVTGVSESEIIPNKDASAIVMTKWTGVEGTAILAEKYADKLSERLPQYMIEDGKAFKKLLSIREDAQIAIKEGASYLHDVSSGGIFAALWELADMAGCGIDVDLKSIPIRQETIEITNHLGYNPYQMLSGGSLLFITDREDETISTLNENGIEATVIGRTTDSNDRIIRNDGEIRFLDKPQADELLKTEV